MKTFLILFVCLAAFCAKGQTLVLGQDTLQLHADHFVDGHDTTTHSLASSFVVYGNQKISWAQKDGGYVLDYPVQSVTGTWADLATDGSMDFAVKFNTKSGTFHIEKSQGVLTVSMQFPENGKNTMPYTFYIDTYAKQ